MSVGALSMTHWGFSISLMENEMGALIRAARTSKGLRLQDLADAIGKAPSFVSKVETGAMKEMVPPADLNAIAGVLELDVVDLLQAAGYQVRKSDPGAAPEIPPHMRASFLRQGELPPDKQDFVKQMVDMLYVDSQKLVAQMKKDRARRIEEGVEE